MAGKVDLHTHTNHSDGFHSPSGLLELAASRQIRTISITDHDTVDGVKEAMKHAVRFGIEIIPGVEFSSYHNDQEVHILAYFIPLDDPELKRYLTFFRLERERRAERIIAKLNKLNVDLTMEDIRLAAGRSTIGRPHIANALLQKGFVKSFGEAFIQYLGNNAPAYERKVHISPGTLFKLVNDLGGLSFLAHPGNMPEDTIKDIIDMGVDGIEVVHPSHSQSQVEYYTNIVNTYFLLGSGGSDFHGGKRADETNLGKYCATPDMISKMKINIKKHIPYN